MLHQFNEVYLRTFSKLITWRVLQINVSFISAYIFTGNYLTGLKFAASALVVNSVIFWLHERFWNSFDWKRHMHKNLKFTESQVRTIGKMITWRILMICSVYLIAFITTGSWSASLGIMSSMIIVNAFIYWAHERTWNRIMWGKQENVTK